MITQGNNSLIRIPDRVTTISISNPYAAAIVNGHQMAVLNDDEQYNFLIDLLGITNFIGGWGVKSDPDMQGLAEILQEDLKTKYKLLTDEEVKTAFKKGAKGEYGENPGGLSIPSCLRWLNCYQQDVKRQDAKKLIDKALETSGVKTKWTRGQSRAYAQQNYDRYLKSGPFVDYGNVIYNILDAERLITYSITEKNNFIERGRKVVFDRLQVWRTLDEKRENDKKLDDLIAGNSEAAVMAEGRQLALMQFFENLYLQKVDIIVFSNTCLKFGKWS